MQVKVANVMSAVIQSLFLACFGFCGGDTHAINGFGDKQLLHVADNFDNPAEIGHVPLGTPYKDLVAKDFGQNTYLVVLVSIPIEGGYQLVLVNNRDELYNRPTQPLEFWHEHPSCIGGVDLHPGREGGTWLGMCAKQGKIGNLLNIMGWIPDPKYQSRGHIVTDFITSDKCVTSYLQDIKESGCNHAGFNIILLEKMTDGWHLGYYSNGEGEDYISDVRLYKEETLGFSNSVPEKPFQKVVFGKERFAEILEECPSVADKGLLQSELFKLMNCTDRKWPDPQIEKQATGKMPKESMLQRTAVFVDSSQVMYGTRTTSIILVDSAGNCDFVERTMREPVIPSRPIWDLSSHCFQLGSDDKHTLCHVKDHKLQRRENSNI